MILYLDLGLLVYKFKFLQEIYEIRYLFWFLNELVVWKCCFDQIGYKFVGPLLRLLGGLLELICRFGKILTKFN